VSRAFAGLIKTPSSGCRFGIRNFRYHYTRDAGHTLNMSKMRRLRTAIGGQSSVQCIQSRSPTVRRNGNCQVGPPGQLRARGFTVNLSNSVSALDGGGTSSDLGNQNVIWSWRTSSRREAKRRERERHAHHNLRRCERRESVVDSGDWGRARAPATRPAIINTR